MVLMKQYNKAADDDYEHMSVVTGSMRLVLKALHKGLLPHEKYTENELIAFCSSLMDNQESDGSWRVFKDQYTIAEEDEVDFVFFPTQIACAILTQIRRKFSTAKLPGLDEAISKGLKFAVSKSLEGYGYNSLFQKLESLIIFIEGSVVELLNSDPRICPSCYNCLLDIREKLQVRLDKGDTKMEYGGDYREQFEYVLEGLKGI